MFDRQYPTVHDLYIPFPVFQSRLEQPFDTTVTSIRELRTISSQSTVYGYDLTVNDPLYYDLEPLLGNSISLTLDPKLTDSERLDAVYLDINNRLANCHGDLLRKFSATSYSIDTSVIPYVFLPMYRYLLHIMTGSAFNSLFRQMIVNVDANCANADESLLTSAQHLFALLNKINPSRQLPAPLRHILINATIADVPYDMQGKFVPYNVVFLPTSNESLRDATIARIREPAGYHPRPSIVVPHYFVFRSTTDALCRFMYLAKRTFLHVNDKTATHTSVRRCELLRLNFPLDQSFAQLSLLVQLQLPLSTLSIQRLPHLSTTVNQLITLASSSYSEQAIINLLRVNWNVIGYIELSTLGEPSLPAIRVYDFTSSMNTRSVTQGPNVQIRTRSNAIDVHVREFIRFGRYLPLEIPKCRVPRLVSLQVINYSLNHLLSVTPWPDQYDVTRHRPERIIENSVKRTIQYQEYDPSVGTWATSSDMTNYTHIPSDSYYHQFIVTCLRSFCGLRDLPRENSARYPYVVLLYGLALGHEIAPSRMGLTYAMTSHMISYVLSTITTGIDVAPSEIISRFKLFLIDVPFADTIIHDLRKVTPNVNVHSTSIFTSNERGDARILTGWVVIRIAVSRFEQQKRSFEYMSYFNDILRFCDGGIIHFDIPDATFLMHVVTSLQCTPNRRVKVLSYFASQSPFSLTLHFYRDTTDPLLPVANIGHWVTRHQMKRYAYTDRDSTIPLRHEVIPALSTVMSRMTAEYSFVCQKSDLPVCLSALSTISNYARVATWTDYRGIAHWSGSAVIDPLRLLDSSRTGVLATNVPIEPLIAPSHGVPRLERSTYRVVDAFHLCSLIGPIFIQREFNIWTASRTSERTRHVIDVGGRDGAFRGLFPHAMYTVIDPAPAPQHMISNYISEPWDFNDFQGSLDRIMDTLGIIDPQDVFLVFSHVFISALNRPAAHVNALEQLGALQCSSVVSTQTSGSSASTLYSSYVNHNPFLEIRMENAAYLTRTYPSPYPLPTRAEMNEAILNNARSRLHQTSAAEILDLAMRFGYAPSYEAIVTLPALCDQHVVYAIQ
ncbi:VP3 [Mycoreovirus 1]|uniref:Outer capsid protein VP3 n=2 Tax=Cryphonectria parasitica mycoreovirus 1 (strain 9B21) TaxID=230407 RepID=VP3_MYRV9|nr:VP3 [Mycoreovirus 1]Q7TDB4.1 RecName: Full=Outer capsid protein VP3; Includes: RecName: Full=mRNA guanylyltransferase; Includes: RecName: Full=mRNA (guanine-N(7))-methyltransferase [Cryphonectria parasitica mycoreovirus 1]AAP45579.1 VP3 [Cryphonectria parasitica mycoreovirus 1]BAS02071.1 VP3 protein [Cryphonectria parasitica mycoreovirus 1]